MTETHSHGDHHHMHDALDADDYAGLLHAMNHRLATLAKSLTPEQWTAPSLCDGWRACDVIGHMAYGGRVAMWRVLPIVLFKYRGNVTKGSKHESIRLASSVD